MGRQVSSSFNIFKHGRMSHNNRPYLVKAVQSLLKSKAVQEALQLKELFGYFGHGKRALSGKLKPEEVEVAMVDGKPVVLDAAPACVLIDINCDDEGNVSFTQEFLDTDTGKTADAMEKAKAGGWSWATFGTPSNITGLGGIDYVKKPSYVSNDKRKALMLESAGQELDENSWIKHCLESVGLGEKAELILESWNEMPEVNDDNSLELENLMLESKLAVQEESHSAEIEAIKNDYENKINALKRAEKKRKELMLESIQQLPILMNQNQQAAFIDMATQEDVEEVKLMFESWEEKATSLPFNTVKKGVVINKAGADSCDIEALDGCYDLSGENLYPFPEN